MLKLFITPERGIRKAMFERDKYIIWEAGEVIYRAGDPSNEAFLIMEGSVQIFTSEGLLLNRIGTNEILGETSLLLNVSRSVTAIAALTGAKATRIPRQYFEDIAARDRVMGALIRKNQYRLIDSNTQSNMLGTEIERLSVLVENAIKNGFSKKRRHRRAAYHNCPPSQAGRVRQAPRLSP